MAERVYWVSRHALSPAQVNALKILHGENVTIIHETVQFTSDDGLAEYIWSHLDGLVYAVAGAQHYLTAAAEGLRFGVMANHPGKRRDGQFGLAGVYWWRLGEFLQVWSNPDPDSDSGESLLPVGH